MPRPLNEIIAHIRAAAGDPSIKATLIQTEDLEALCDAASPGAPRAASPFVQQALTAKPGWKVQPFEYFAAQFLVGSGLTQGDLDANIRGLAAGLRQQYDIGVEHGRTAPENPTPARP